MHCNTVMMITGSHHTVMMSTGLHHTVMMSTGLHHTIMIITGLLLLLGIKLCMRVQGLDLG